MLPEYTWVDLEVDTYFSRYNHLSDLSNLISWLPICTITNPDACLVTFHTVRSNATSLTEFMFMNREGMNKDFFYKYDCLFCDLYVRVSFDDFTMGVLRILNGWTTMQAFCTLCFYSSMSATPKLFLHYFCSCPQDKAQWISLIRLLKHLIFCLFTCSYKNLWSVTSK